MSDHTLTDWEKESIKSLVIHYDSSGNGTLEFDEFIHFLRALPNVDLNKLDTKNITETDIGMTIDQIRIFYDGMDLDKTHSVDANEICEFINATRTKDLKWQTKMIFRAADKDKSRKVSFEELSYCLKALQGIEMTEEDFQQKTEDNLGKSKKELEYWEFYKIISGEEIDHKTDPYAYDKKEESQSKCCIII